MCPGHIEKLYVTDFLKPIKSFATKDIVKFHMPSEPPYAVLQKYNSGFFISFCIKEKYS